MKITNIVYDSNSEDENEMFFFCRRCEGLETQIDFVRDKRIEEDLFIAINLQRGDSARAHTLDSGPM